MGITQPRLAQRFLAKDALVLKERRSVVPLMDTLAGVLKYAVIRKQKRRVSMGITRPRLAQRFLAKDVLVLKEKTSVVPLMDTLAGVSQLLKYAVIRKQKKCAMMRIGLSRLAQRFLAEDALVLKEKRSVVPLMDTLAGVSQLLKYAVIGKQKRRVSMGITQPRLAQRFLSKDALVLKERRSVA